MHLLLMYISHLFNHLAFILQDDYITRLFYSKHLLCFFIYFSSRFSTRNIWYVNLYIFLRCYKNFGMEISIWLSYYTKKNQSDFIFWLIFVSSVHFSSNRYAIGGNDRNRTGTRFDPRRILSPVRLPPHSQILQTSSIWWRN